ncbi:MAG: hypothetical protein R3F11_17785 [Verrucomicrobiales bacterium]
MGPRIAITLNDKFNKNNTKSRIWIVLTLQIQGGFDFQYGEKIPQRLTKPSTPAKALALMSLTNAILKKKPLLMRGMTEAEGAQWTLEHFGRDLWRCRGDPGNEDCCAVRNRGSRRNCPEAGKARRLRRAIRQDVPDCAT